MNIENTHIETIKQLKTAILSSRYRVAVLANKEMLGLYFAVGKLISEKAHQENGAQKFSIFYLKICKKNYPD